MEKIPLNLSPSDRLTFQKRQTNIGTPHVLINVFFFLLKKGKKKIGKENKRQAKRRMEALSSLGHHQSWRQWILDTEDTARSKTSTRPQKKMNIKI